MKNSQNRIVTTQAGSLPRPDELIEANLARESGETSDEPAFQKTLQSEIGRASCRERVFLSV